MRFLLSWREEKFYVSKLGRGKGITYNAEVRLLYRHFLMGNLGSVKL